MSGAGRPSERPELRLLKNDKAHDHRYKGQEFVQASINAPLPPEYLSERAKEIFLEFTSRVAEVGIASDTDLDLMVMYANNQEELEYYERVLRTEGSTYECTARNGECNIKPRPEKRMYDNCNTLKFKILTEFGLSPISRKKVPVKKKTTEVANPFARLGK